jgi:hypothetical protein
LWLIAGFFTFGLCLLPLSLRRNHRRILLAFIVLIVIAAVVACGSGSSNSSGGGGGGGGGTPVGNYNVTLEFDIAGPLQIIYVNVDVQ